MRPKSHVNKAPRASISARCMTVAAIVAYALPAYAQLADIAAAGAVSGAVAGQTAPVTAAAVPGAPVIATPEPAVAPTPVLSAPVATITSPGNSSSVITPEKLGAGNAAPIKPNAAAAIAKAGAAPVVSIAPAVEEARSIFFTQEEMRLLREALKAYDRFRMIKSSDAQNQAKDFLNQLEEAKKTQFEKSYEYSQFFLESLVYHTPDDWYVRVNKQKLTPDKPEKFGLKAVAVDSEKVLFEWRPADMQPVMETWSKNANNSITIDQVAGTVTFTLRPNQTFSSYLMKVLEGKVKPVRLDGADGVKSPQGTDPASPNGLSASPATGQPPVDPAEGASAPGADTGLTGLINHYKNIEVKE